MLFHVIGKNYRICFKIYTKVMYQIQSTFESQSVKRYDTVQKRHFKMCGRSSKDVSHKNL